MKFKFLCVATKMFNRSMRVSDGVEVFLIPYKCLDFSKKNIPSTLNIIENLGQK